ncbi:MAG: hypothetical protein GXO40_01020 [Epsilonproteobacteria bacterium]|nr:hypothetical protein [Campylobacterota bacterium]
MRYLIVLFLVVSIYGVSIKSPFSASFKQIVYSTKPLTYTGVVYFKDGLILWDYRLPFNKKIWVNKDKITVYDVDLQQVSFTHNNNLLTLIQNAKPYKNNIYKNKYHNQDIYFTIKNHTVYKIEYTNNIGEKIVIRFFDITHKDISPKIFIPTYPDDVDILNYQNR